MRVRHAARLPVVLPRPRGPARPRSPRASVAQAIRVALAVAAGFLAVFALAGALRSSSPRCRSTRTCPGSRSSSASALFVLGAGHAGRLRAQRAACPGSTGAGASARSGRCSCSACRTPSPPSDARCPCSWRRWPGTISRDSVVGGLRRVRRLRARHDAGAAGADRGHRAGPHVDRAVPAAGPALHRPGVRRARGPGRGVRRLLRLARGAARPGRRRCAGSSITDTVTGWSTDVTQWISDVGSVRIAVVVVILLAGTVPGAPTRLGRAGDRARLVAPGGQSPGRERVSPFPRPGQGPSNRARRRAQGARRSTRQPEARAGSRR